MSHRISVFIITAAVAVGCGEPSDNGDAGTFDASSFDAERPRVDGGEGSFDARAFDARTLDADAPSLPSALAGRMPPGGWPVPRCEDDFSTGWAEIDVSTVGIVPGADVSAALEALIEGLESPTVVRFPAGTYDIHDVDVGRDQVVLRGAGADQTIFRIRDGSRGFTWSGGEASEPVGVMADVAPGSRVVPVADLTGFSSGDVVLVVEDLDAWSFPAAQRGRGGVFVVASTDAASSSLTLDAPLAIGLNDVVAKNATVTRLDPVEEVGIADVGIVHEGAAGNILHFNRVSRAFVRSVATFETTKHHVAIARSRAVAVCHSRMQEATNKGGGGFGYGVLLDELTTRSLVSDNVLVDLRHQIGVQWGANLNVVSYNLTVDSVRDLCLGEPPSGCATADWIRDPSQNGLTDGVLESDIVIHGNYPHHNLFEGNAAYVAIVDLVHGPNGPGQLFYRNRFEGQPASYGSWVEGIAMWIDGPSDGQTLAANDLANGSRISLHLHRGEQMPADTWIAANRVGGSIEWGELPEDTALPASLYLDARPAFWPADLDWPPFGPGASDGRIPAQVREGR